MAITDTTPRQKATSRTPLMIAAAVVVVMGAMALDTTVVQIGSDLDARKQAFSPDAYGAAQFPAIQSSVTERAIDAAKLATELTADKAAAIAAYGVGDGIGPVIPVRLTGVVANGRSGIYDVTVAGVPDTIRIRVQTGPAINGTDLRDATGDIAFGAFTNQIEYQDAGAGINRAMSEAILSDVDRDALTGRTLTVTGVFKLINPKNWLITPVEFDVQ
ncbi:DUF2291 family protein [Celeribacter marinus]|uniref:DUF2291 family protein n=1 Tax=Celeribacter marinus TaxID=1397108 RepID=UPI003F6AE487